MFISLAGPVCPVIKRMAFGIGRKICRGGGAICEQDGVVFGINYVKRMRKRLDNGFKEGVLLNYSFFGHFPVGYVACGPYKADNGSPGIQGAGLELDEPNSTRFYQDPRLSGWKLLTTENSLPLFLQRWQIIPMDQGAEVPAHPLFRFPAGYLFKSGAQRRNGPICGNSVNNIERMG